MPERMQSGTMTPRSITWINMLVTFSSAGMDPGAKVAAIRPSQASARKAAAKKSKPAIQPRGSFSEKCDGSVFKSKDIMLRINANRLRLNKAT